jgi:inosine triphosphate pyrophosphatase
VSSFRLSWAKVERANAGFARRYAEMDGVEKNKISHRYRALDKLRTFLLEQAKE